MQAKEDRDRSPEGRFKYLAEKRVGKALTAIRSIANLSDRKNYEYSEDQVIQIISALDNAVQEVKDDFARNQRQRERGGNFELK
jgi:hypothetical protein|tara:strand:+ start:285 stop:536 length:252 start_codon:yes stop_codon:yes gene_type:complete